MAPGKSNAMNEMEDCFWLVIMIITCVVGSWYLHLKNWLDDSAREEVKGAKPAVAS